MIRLFIALAAFTFVTACDEKAKPAAAPIRVGGIAIGMSMDDYRNVTSKPPGFSLGGVVGAPEAVFVDGKVSEFNWRFGTEKYPVVKRALLADFPELKCEMANGYEVCVAKGQGAVYLAEGQRGNWSSRVWLQRAVRGGN